MYSQSDIDDAVAGGALSADQAASFRGYVATRNGVPTADEEYFRLVTGFNDIFVTVASLFLLIAIGWLGNEIPPKIMGSVSPFAAILVTAAAWGLAEIFTRQRHMALPSIFLLICFVWGFFASILLLLVAVMGPENFDGTTGGILAAVCAALAAAAAYMHWKRFQVPITVATGVGMVIIAIVALIATLSSGDPRGFEMIMKIILLLAGLGTFVYAMMWDGKDLRRETSRSDVAFWLHWLAAGLIVNALLMLFDMNMGVATAGGAIAVVVIYLVFCLIALAIDRRVVLIAALSPLILAINTLIRGEGSGRLDSYGGGYGDPSYGGGYPPPGGGYGSSYGSSLLTHSMITMLVIGVLLILLAIYWTQLRRMVVGALPEGLRARVPAAGVPPVVADDYKA